SWLLSLACNNKTLPVDQKDVYWNIALDLCRFGIDTLNDQSSHDILRKDQWRKQKKRLRSTMRRLKKYPHDPSQSLCFLWRWLHLIFKR
ncbi:MAG: hypothetical protein AAB505_02055, partial [Patescibacteria group bacterium]